MIFDVDPSQINSLDSKQLVTLLSKLLHVEAQRTGIGLSGVSVPLQINVPDGGEDARVSWQGGLGQTDYFPSRFCIFQSKASDPGPAGWKKEVWTKSSQKKGASRQLNQAVTKAISERGSYIGFTSAAVIGGNYDRRIDEIKQGIRDAGADPTQLKAIDIYDANKISKWASQHPAVAVWLNELQSGVVLKGFQTVEHWGKRPEISSIPHVDDTASRFSLRGRGTPSRQRNKTPGTDTLTFQQACERIADYLADSQKSVRLIGPSGVGKTRFVYEIFRDSSAIAKMVLSTSAIYCDYRDVDQHILMQITQNLSEALRSALLIVDECPREVAVRLHIIACMEDCRLRILTIGNDDRQIENDNCLNIMVAPADDDLVKGIIQHRFPKAPISDITFITTLSGGFPRIAVLATDNYSEQAPILKSVDDIIERILTGCEIRRPDQIRAIECLALFTRLGVDEELSEQIDLVAETLARQTGDEMYEHLAQASKHDIVERRSGFFMVQPLPIAAFLGARRLDLLRVSTILNFIEIAKPQLLDSFLSQWRHFDVSTTAVTVAERLLKREDRLGSLERLNTEQGLRSLDALVHVTPDVVADTVSQVFGKLTVDQLSAINNGRLYLIWALQKLVFRRSSFLIAARLLMRLGAAHKGQQDNHAASHFNQLFQLRMSGTEADPVDRFFVLDEGLSSEDDRIISVCVEALENTLTRRSFTRLLGSEQIGTRRPLKDWDPKLWEEVFSFHRRGLKRLADVRVKHEQFSQRCETIIATHIRALLSQSLFSDIETVLSKIAKERGIWLEAIQGVGEWLYFDRKEASKELSKKVRDLYDSLFPTDLILLALLYTKFWSADIRDPDQDYDKDKSYTGDFEYSSRKAREVATQIAREEELTERAIRTMAAEQLNNVFPFCHQLALRVKDPVKAFKTAVKTNEASGDANGLGFICGMLAGIDERNQEAANTCLKIALDSEALKDHSIHLYSALRISVERLAGIVHGLKTGTVAAGDCASISYGRRLNPLSAEEIFPLLDELGSNHEAEGIWTALEIAAMYQHGREELDKQLAARIKFLLTSPRLLGKVRRGNRDGHLFLGLTLSIRKHFEIDEEFASELSRQITRLCQVDDREVFSALDRQSRQIMRMLVDDKPKQLWEIVSRFFEIATPLERQRLAELVGSAIYDFGAEDHIKQGPLFGVPEADCIEWAKNDPENNLPFLCLFYPLLETIENGQHVWHPALERLTDELGAVEEFRQAMGRRLHPQMWSDSIVPYLEVFLDPLKIWFSHSVPEIAAWARETHRQLERQIAAEIKLEDEIYIS